MEINIYQRKIKTDIKVGTRVRIANEKGEFFALIAKGSSMVNAGINEGDYVIVRKQSSAKVGDLVVALYDNGLNNLKKLCYDAEQQRYFLYSCNVNQESYAPIYVDELQIQGVAVCTVHNLLQE